MMDDKKIVKGVLGNKQGLEGLAKDSDGDGHINALDCEPNNPKKQGFVHDLINKARGHLEAAKKERAERKDREFETRSKAAEAFQEEKQKQAIETARFKARDQAKKERTKISSGGGFLGGFGLPQPRGNKFIQRINVPQATPSENLSGLLGGSNSPKKKKGIMDFKI